MITTPVDLTDPVYSNEDAARAHIEALRWPDGPVCPLCGCTGRIDPLGGKSMGPGWYYCGDCRGKFTVRVGSIFERSHVPLHKWLLAFRLMASSKKGVSAHQIHRSLGVTYKTAWFMAHRIREAMRPVDPPKMGGPDEPVQADETYIGVRARVRRNNRQPKGAVDKMTVVALVSGGKSRSFHVDHANLSSIGDILRQNASPSAELHTDESLLYRRVGKEFAAHKKVNHSKGEYLKKGAHSNGAENYFSIFKRGMKGIYQHCSEKHLQRYLFEFDFRYSNRSGVGIEDAERTALAIKGAAGKRLTYRRPRSLKAYPLVG